MKDIIKQIQELNKELGDLKDKKVQVVNHKLDLWIESTNNYENLGFEVDDIYIEFNNVQNEQMNKNYVTYDTGLCEKIYNIGRNFSIIKDMYVIDKLFNNIPEIENLLKEKMDKAVKDEFTKVLGG